MIYNKYKRVFLKFLPLILIVSFGCSVGAYLVVKRVGPTYQVHFSYLISLSERETSSDFRFDGYYALQAIDSFALTLAQWTQTPEVIVAAYEQSGIEEYSNDPRELSRSVLARKTAPQLIEVTVHGKNKKEAIKLTNGLITVMKSNIEHYHDQGVPVLKFKVVNTSPWAGSEQVSVRVVSIAVFLVVFILLVNTVLLLESLKQVK